MLARLLAGLTGIGRIGAGILAAWRHELAFLLPRAGSDRGAIVLEFGPSEMIAFHASKAGEQMIGRTYHDSANVQHDLATLVQMASLPRGISRDVIVRLHPDHVLHRTLQLPLANAWVLRKAVRYELDRISPLDSDRIVFDMKVVSRDRKRRRATVVLRLVKRDLVERVLDQCKQSNFKLAELRCSRASSGGAWAGFPVDPYAAARMTWRRWSTVILTALALILTGCIVVTEYARGAAIERAVALEIDGERKRAAAVQAIRAEVAIAREKIAFLSDQRRRPLLVVLLTDLSGLVPNNAWATELELSSGGVRIRGYGASASSLIGVLERSQRFANARFVAPLTRGPAADSERFDLSAEVETTL